MMLQDLLAAEKIALDLENALKENKRDLISISFQQLNEKCKQCHSAYRN